MYKYPIILLIAGIFCFNASYAQYGMGGRYRPYHSQRYGQYSYFKPTLILSVGYGFPNLDKYYLWGFNQDYIGSIKQTGPVHASLDYQFNRTSSIGLMVGYGKVSAPYYNYSGTATQPDFTGHLENWAIMLNLVRYFPVSETVNPYIRTAFGVNIWNQNYEDMSGNKIAALPDPSLFAYQASIGAKVKLSDHLGLFAEAGYGKYIVSGGVFFKLL